MTLLAVDWLLIIEKLVLIAIIVFASLGIALYTTFAERKVALYYKTVQDLTGLALLDYSNLLPMD